MPPRRERPSAEGAPVRGGLRKMLGRKKRRSKGYEYGRAFNKRNLKRGG